MIPLTHLEHFDQILSRYRNSIDPTEDDILFVADFIRELVREIPELFDVTGKTWVDLQTEYGFTPEEINNLWRELVVNHRGDKEHTRLHPNKSISCIVWDEDPSHTRLLLGFGEVAHWITNDYKRLEKVLMEAVDAD